MLQMALTGKADKCLKVKHTWLVGMFIMLCSQLFSGIEGMYMRAQMQN